VSFDLHDPDKAKGYYDVAMTAAGEAEDDAVAAWVLANLSYLHAHPGATNAALEAAQGAAARVARCADVTTQHAWLIRVPGVGVTAQASRASSEPGAVPTGGHAG
jgi:hypothetical protein